MEDFWIEHRYSSCNYQLRHHYEYTYQILFLLSGRISYQVGEKKYEVSRGGMIVLNTLEEHTLEVLEYPYERYIIQIAPTFFRNEVKYPEIISIFIRRPADFSHLLTFKEPVWNDIYGLVQEMEREYLGRRPYWDMYVGADLRKMFITIFRECEKALSVKKMNSSTEIAYRVMNYLEHHYTEDISLDSVAAALYLNKNYIAHVFKDETGYSPMDYTISLRMSHAKALLMETNQSISDIAEKCGYTDFAYFSKQFKKNTGFSPTVFRKSEINRMEDRK
ncbi:helix-turn-helix domain-containing protein [Clostridium sp. MCC353]|uniref:helix-turn-helix transcriptional regulator n=1 Tax=Clostridium sp. MCC353 TaxID=2592646 RepID=UPI001C023E42|nr:helix-turn-helix domain-containing protein [Clostridium sp. MCC353]MBT9775187.1 helix-turn-helix domain-containing protein [Clostridium sp. MCC353]